MRKTLELGLVANFKMSTLSEQKNGEKTIFSSTLAATFPRPLFLYLLFSDFGDKFSLELNFLVLKARCRKTMQILAIRFQMWVKLLVAAFVIGGWYC